MNLMTTTTLIKRILGPVQPVPTSAQALTLRYAVPADTPELDRLAQLDSAHAPRGVVLVAEVGGELWAAVSVDDPRVAVADPFRPTGELLALLVERARQLGRSERGRRNRLPRVWPDAGWDRPALN
jgi:hypothetical protein